MVRPAGLHHILALFREAGVLLKGRHQPPHVLLGSAPAIRQVQIQGDHVGRIRAESQDRPLPGWHASQPTQNCSPHTHSLPRCNMVSPLCQTASASPREVQRWSCCFSTDGGAAWCPRDGTNCIVPMQHHCVDAAHLIGLHCSVRSPPLMGLGALRLFYFCCSVSEDSG